MNWYSLKVKICSKGKQDTQEIKKRIESTLTEKFICENLCYEVLIEETYEPQTEESEETK